MSLDQPSAGSKLGANALGFLVALALHVAVAVGFAYSISFRFVQPQPVEPQIVALAPQLLPPPPAIEQPGSDDVIALPPRFRPREPLAPSAEAKKRGSPALAVWSYLCNRDLELSEAARRKCPTFDFGAVGLSLLDPLNRVGDVGALFGADTATMSLEEAAIARGWLKRPPPKGQGALVGKTDKVDQPAEPELYKSLPQLKHSVESAPNVK